MPPDSGSALGRNESSGTLDLDAVKPSPLRRGFLLLLGGTTAGQIALVVAAPILARLYTPEQFGVFGVLLALAAVATSVACLRFDLAIPLPDRLRDSKSLVFLCLLVLGGVVIALVVLSAPMVQLSESVWPDIVIGGWIWFVPALVTLTTSYTVLSQLAVRLQAYPVIGRTTVVQNVGTVVSQALSSSLAAGLMWGALAGRTLGIWSLLVSTGIRPRDYPGRRQLLALSREYWRFPVLFAPFALLNALGGQLVVLVLPSLFGATATGQYVMAVRILSLPAAVVGAAAGQVFLGELARVRWTSKATVLRLYLRWSLGLGGAALLLFLGALTAPAVFSFVLGEDWRVAGECALILAAGVAAGLVASPLAHTWTVYQRGVVSGLWDASRLGLIAIALVLAAKLELNLTMTLILISTVTFVTYLISWVGCLMTVVRDRGYRDEGVIQ